MSFELVHLEDLAAPIKNAIVGGPFGSNLVSKDYAESGVPVIRGQNMGRRWIAGPFAFVSPDKAESLSANKARPGDLVFTQRGTLGQVAIVPSGAFPEYIVSQSQMKITLNPARADVKFIYYVFCSQEQLDHIKNTAIQTGVPHINLGLLRKTPLRLPPLAVQREIAEVLGSLDDCIAILHETNATLEAMAQAIFKSWFVDFDPVRAKAEGRQPERMDGATAALFPDSFEDSELGDVPAGWSVFPIGELVKCVGGATPSTKNSEFWEPAEFAWTTPKDLSGLQSPILHKTEKMVSSKGVLKISSGLLPAGTLLMSSRAPIGYLAISSIAVAVNQGYIAIPPGGKLSPLYLLHWCRQNMELIKSHANGSTFMEISKKAFRPLPALLPSVEVLAEFTKRVSPIFESIAANDRQINLLAEIRDTLLPKLISGEIRLPEAESIVRSVVNA
ncbi:TPA: restriction endonuclease subunit S [Pseudomonas aeruginosa]|uniref:restriction endonuclease subunit S n=1 Tax=Pseudomonas aeruginosa TaxID=287 RepID=UPI000F81B998|nr:restriction endonuclease subunit S [Pseudomonas aeruginosa]MDC3887822.1 restriction endonuclease subunit S [Pseudomonas aeruginosa]MDY1141236.1 restriction endonuclease subunit S [Pseudomonas aeruginosa]RTR73254.1 restriction endonuclease subunit S [Pseudomonas aeruginosa]HCF0643926.1 restriction endonuclease subunit S [Pseudomonas aeruginosa]